MNDYLYTDNWIRGVSYERPGDEGRQYAAWFLRFMLLDESEREVYLKYVRFDPVLCKYRGNLYQCIGCGREMQAWLKRVGALQEEVIAAPIAACENWQRYQFPMNLL